jgi:hypothetical protein
VTEPGTTDPGTTDPGTTDPGTTDPGTTDPGTTEPGTTDPGTTDPGTTDPGTTDPGTTDPGTTDPGTTTQTPTTTTPSNTTPSNTTPSSTPSQTTTTVPTGSTGSGASAASEADDTDDDTLVTIGSGTQGDSSASSGTTKKSTSTTTSKSFLHLKATGATKSTQTLTWTKSKDADGYQIYGALCGEKTYKLLKTVKASSSRTWTRTKLTAGTYYKYYVVSYKLVNGKKTKIAKSNTVHSVTSGSKYGNPTKVTVDLKELSVTVKVKKTVKLSATASYKSSKRINLNHADLMRYRSSNTKIATVKKDGTITGKKAGTCYIYCYAVSGIYRKVKVTVTKK